MSLTENKMLPAHARFSLLSCVMKSTKAQRQFKPLQWHVKERELSLAVFDYLIQERAEPTGVT
jgi:hypothetical protein